MCCYCYSGCSVMISSLQFPRVADQPSRSSLMPVAKRGNIFLFPFRAKCSEYSFHGASHSFALLLYTTDQRVSMQTLFCPHCSSRPSHVPVYHVLLVLGPAVLVVVVSSIGIVPPRKKRGTVGGGVGAKSLPPDCSTRPWTCWTRRRTRRRARWPRRESRKSRERCCVFIGLYRRQIYKRVNEHGLGQSAFI